MTEKKSEHLYSETNDEEKRYVLAIDQGTTSSRAILFDRKGEIVSVGQLEHEQIFPKAGWVEHDPQEIWRNIRRAVGDCLSEAEVNHHDIAAVGITNQRETTVVWDKNTGEPVYNAIVWQDVRTAALCEELAGDVGPDRYQATTGLPPTTATDARLLIDGGAKYESLLVDIAGAREHIHLEYYIYQPDGIGTALRDALGRWPQGVYALWYPIKRRAERSANSAAPPRRSRVPCPNRARV